jgi:hypothetical protein
MHAGTAHAGTVCFSRTFRFPVCPLPLLPPFTLLTALPVAHNQALLQRVLPFWPCSASIASRIALRKLQEEKKESFKRKEGETAKEREIARAYHVLGQGSSNHAQTDRQKSHVAVYHRTHGQTNRLARSLTPVVWRQHEMSQGQIGY